MKRCSTSLITREMQVKPPRGVTAQLSAWLAQTTGDKCGWMWTTGNPVHCWWDCKLHGFCGELREVSTNRMEVPYHLAVSVLGFYLKETKRLIGKDSSPLCSHSIIYRSHDMEAAWAAIHRWAKRRWGCYSAIERMKSCMCDNVGRQTWRMSSEMS